MIQSSKLLSVFKPDTLSGVLTLFNDHNLWYYQTGPEDAITTDAIGRPSGEILVGLST